MVCTGCKAKNPDGKAFCGECGTALERPTPAGVPGEDSAWYCTKHTKVMTGLRCGRCETPICPKCTVHTPAGTRCRVCARNKIAVRPVGVLHSAVGAVQGASPIGRRVWYLALWYFLLSFLRNPFEW